MMLESNEKSFDKDVLEEKGKVLVFFYRDRGCSFCDKMKPVVAEYAERHPDIKVVRYALGQAPDSVNMLYPIERFPTFYAFENGQVVGKQEGAMSLEQLHLTFEPNKIEQHKKQPEPLSLDKASMIQLKQEEAAIIDTLAQIKQHYLAVKREIKRRQDAVESWDRELDEK